MNSAQFSRARAGATYLAAAMIIACTSLSGAQASSFTAPVVQDTYITASLPGVVGDFTLVANAPTNSIQVLSMSVGAFCSPTTPGGSCTGPDVSNLTVFKAIDGASPKLFMDLLSGTSFATATFQFWQRPASGTTYTKTYTIYLTDALLTSLQDGATEGSSPYETLSFGFKTIAFQDNIFGSVSCYNALTKTTTAAATC